MLTSSLPLSRSLDLPVCLARCPAARLWLKDAVTRVKERPGFQSLEDSANLPAPDIIAAEWSERSVLGSRDIDGQTREGERAGAKESMG
jgi:hypothetical protein